MASAKQQTKAGRTPAEPADPVDPAAEHGRLGPRPLPLHLATAILTWQSSCAAWPLSRTGSLLWNPDLKPTAERLQRDLADADPEAFAQALQRAVGNRVDALMTGIERYHAHHYRRATPPPPITWQSGTTRLLDYGPRASTADAVPLLVVPSLINRAYVLDLSERTSMMRYLARQGLRPFLVDWDAPGEAERGFGLTDYVAGRLDDALHEVLRLTGKPPVVVGYCLGGLLALALTVRRQRDVAGLALLATPWDFHADRSDHGALAIAWAAAMEPFLAATGELPVDALQAMFACLDPYLVPQKFRAFAGTDPASPQAETFVAVEDWLNDGVPLVAPVARELLRDWYGANATARGAWRIAGDVVRPADIRVPSCVVLPAQDRIVPPASAAALADALPNTHRLNPSAGHVGMIVGARARKAMWRPLADWTREAGAGG